MIVTDASLVDRVVTRLQRFCLVEKIDISFVANGLLDNMRKSVVFDHATLSIYSGNPID